MGQPSVDWGCFYCDGDGAATSSGGGIRSTGNALLPLTYSFAYIWRGNCVTLTEGMIDGLSVDLMLKNKGKMRFFCKNANVAKC